MNAGLTGQVANAGFSVSGNAGAGWHIAGYSWAAGSPNSIWTVTGPANTASTTCAAYGVGAFSAVCTVEIEFSDNSTTAYQGFAASIGVYGGPITISPNNAPFGALGPPTKIHDGTPTWWTDPRSGVRYLTNNTNPWFLTYYNYDIVALNPTFNIYMLTPQQDTEAEQGVQALIGAQQPQGVVVTWTSPPWTDSVTLDNYKLSHGTDGTTQGTSIDLFANGVGTGAVVSCAFSGSWTDTGAKPPVTYSVPPGQTDDTVATAQTFPNGDPKRRIR